MKRVYTSFHDAGQTGISLRNVGKPVGRLECCGCHLFLWTDDTTPVCDCRCHSTFRRWCR